MNKNRWIVVAVSTFVILIGVFTMLAISINRDINEANVEESAGKILRYVEQGKLAIDESETIYTFILNHMYLPKRMREDDLALTVKARIDFYYGTIYEQEENKNSPEHPLYSLGSTLLYALKNQDELYFMGTFSTESYGDYLEQFTDVDEMEQVLSNAINTMARSGKIEKLAVLSESKPLTLRFIYSDGIEIDIEVEIDSFEDNHHASTEYYITTSLSDLLPLFEVTSVK